MLRCSPCTLGRAKAYDDRVMHFPYRRRKAWYQAKVSPHLPSPLANKQPEEYHETWNARTGVEWYYKLRRSRQYRHWPWVTWKDDPLRHHEDDVCRRTFSAKHSATADKPLWNLYELVGQDYRLADTAAVTSMASIIAMYTSRTWNTAAVRRALERVAEKWASIAELQQNLAAAEAWNIATNAVPKGLFTHMKHLVNDIVLLNKKKAFRLEQHGKGILRTNEMKRYYALPYIQGPAMPTTLAQPVGIYPLGKYTMMNGGTRIHPSAYWGTNDVYPQ